MTETPQPETPHTPDAGAQLPTSQPVLLKALRWGLLATLALVVICGGVGWLVAQTPGLVGGILGSLIAGVLLGLTVASIAFANRFITSELYVGIFFGIVLGTWLVKLALFIVATLLLRGQPWLDPMVFFLSLLAGVIVSLALDVLVITRSRIPVISDPTI